ncbi:histidine phosphatase family protein [Bacillus sp. MUM 13]|uniref:histidine phosphatase family protein n=1 Tax=Bacillus sp. MUM 13 TaxID=1678001 RepID=UPI0008F5A4CC|nr:histidine phosphatase family protein [Bacillus sp. MUM 13]OIK09249.1 histidine phosphatase family protein [Bacillus sp. MUM 13]
MELYFIRHAQGEHVLDPPDSLQILDPALSDAGIQQARKLKELFPVFDDDLLIISPLRRTLQTAEYWSIDSACKKVVHPLVGPRMFPLLPSYKAYNCDTVLTKERIIKDFPLYEIEDSNSLYWGSGINTVPEVEFAMLAHQFINWCNGLNTKRTFFVSHDGTITAYRQFLGEIVTRDNFLGDAGYYKVIL